MAQVGNTENRFGGEFMIQDRDHMSDIREGSNDVQSNRVRQSEQSGSRSGQQGGEQNVSGQQGSQRRGQQY